MVSSLVHSEQLAQTGSAFWIFLSCLIILLCRQPCLQCRLTLTLQPTQLLHKMSPSKLPYCNLPVMLTAVLLYCYICWLGSFSSMNFLFLFSFSFLLPRAHSEVQKQGSGLYCISPIQTSTQ